MSDATLEAPVIPTGQRGNRATVARNALYLLVGQIVTTALGVVVNATLGRKLGPADFGLLFLITTMTQLPYVVLDWGQSNYVVAEIAYRRSETGTFIGTILTLRLLGSVLAMGVTALALWAMGYDVSTRTLSAIMMVMSLPLFLSQGVSPAFRGYERMDYDAALSIAAKAFVAVSVFTTLVLGGRVLGVVIAQGAAGVFALLFAFRLFRKLGFPPLKPRWDIARETLVGGTALVIFPLGVMAQQYIDTILISKLAPHEVIGWYGAARSFGGTLAAPVLVIGTSLFPRLSYLAATDRDQLMQEARSALRPMLLVNVLIGVGTYLFADVAIRVLYSRHGFERSVEVLQAIAPSLFFVGLGIYMGTLLNALRKRRRLAMAKVASIGAGIVLTLLLIPWAQNRFGNGGIGAALVSSGSEIVMLLFCLPILPRGFIDRSVASVAVRSLVVGGLTVAAGRLVQSWPVPLRLAIVLSAFVGFSAMLGLIRSSDRALLRGLFGRRSAS